MCKKMLYILCSIMVLSLASTSMAELVAYYPMDEGSGNIVADASGNGYDGTTDGTPTWVDGPPGFGGALRFVGASDGVSCGTWDPAAGTGQLSLACWVYFEGGGAQYQGFMAKRDNMDTATFCTELMRDSGTFYWNTRGGQDYNLAHIDTGVWTHVALTHDGANTDVYINGVHQKTSTTALMDTDTGAGVRFGCADPGGNVFEGVMDEVYFFSTVLTPQEVIDVMEGGFAKSAGSATGPYPANDANDVSRDVLLSWKPGTDNGKSDVYFGTTFEDVNDGVAVSPTQDANSYNPGRLEFDKTYFWRIDDVNSSDSTVTSGAVWSFTTEPYARPIPAQAISATASSYMPGQGPEKTVDLSGYDDVNDFHSTELTDMWLSEASEPNEAWIEYQFASPYKLHEMLVWNYNGPSNLWGYGLKDVNITYSMDGEKWDQISDVFEKATGTADYLPNTTVEFGEVAAKMVRITANSLNWYGFGPPFNQYGLSEVRFMQLPVNARKPDPEDGDTDVSINKVLGWMAGREAAEHKVYFSDDEQSVIDGTAPAETVSDTSYSPLTLDLGSTYYWRVDEVNNANAIPVWEGATWSFTTIEYLVADGFESYNEILTGDDSNLVYGTWIDGYVDPPAIRTNGSTIGYTSGASLETAIVHGGRQSAPVMYDNTSVSLSEVTVSLSDLPIGRNWTDGSPATLSLWVYGDPNNAATDRIYVEVNGVKRSFDGDLSRAQWQEFSIDLASLGINLSNVTSLTIGFESSASGMVFIDDIRLYSPSAIGGLGYGA